MSLDSTGNTLRDYLSIVFRHKAVIITTFVTIMTIVFLVLELKTPVYKASVKMLISAEKQVDSPYYRDLSYNRSQSYIALTQAEIVTSSHVLERAVKVLKLHERPSGYEKSFYSPVRQWLEQKKPQWLINLQQKKTNELKNLSSEQLDEFLLWKAVGDLSRKIEVTPIRDTDVFIITVSDFSPQEAAAIANVVSRSYIICDLEQQLAELQLKYGERHQIVLQLKDSIDKMTGNLSGSPLSYMESIGPATIKIVEQARIPFIPVGTSKHLTLVLAFCMSVVLGIMLSFGFEYLNCTFKSPQEVGKFLNVPVLGFIPRKGFKSKRLVKDTMKITPYTQSYKDLSDKIYLFMRDKNLKSLLITAASPVEDSATIVANLGNFLSKKAGHKVLIIDANIHTSTIHRTFHIPDNPGLTSILRGTISFEKASQHIHNNLSVLTAGEDSHNLTMDGDLFTIFDEVKDDEDVLEGEAFPDKKSKRTNPKLATLLSERVTLNQATTGDTSRMFKVINSAKEKYDIVLVDYANLRNVKDTCLLSSYVDGVILVVNEGKTRRHVIKSLIAPLEQKNANLVGVIFNNRTFAIPGMIYKRV
ncbi:MAG: lipopolysaccharide biosynthesis protein [Candidatus Jettenia sp.]|uniref:Polysaccharide chain length determinant N-terminal domain-containing protein n=1 Tax=Candidatus Jettenia caeni TaxID=247490 RepID=I3IGH8_9BACT|nr:polysaccharide biosynthesis tyrosine autokinase [Candidatus Jettenia sp. AMX1]MBC6929784.1 lipopolysaccharide biosynthesis protein [Candidatus Jettenia sp.]GAB60823.1 conserved hypothetical protein [Candidatus Jettenia caeni]KAA0248788.1 MAG: lipopolysaccharide biosynthesis protein [Candidatus Jettenia sp. AMX1]MCE7881400.1 lipopolysaccharide biosynthesis protein [Candidatus Jettenia sp. AMX1]MCQ3927981.1 lipopolysaccharide biosynthesis protein [Candidatus Jettenia sp.]